MASLDLIAAFVYAARHASFAKAARELDLSPSAVAKNVARFETQLGLRLFHRTTRQVTLSQDGEEVFERCQRILEDVESLDAVASAQGREARGTLRIDLPITYGKHVVLPVLSRLMGRHPELRVDARFSDRFVDLVKEGLDAAVRVGALADSQLVARQFDQQVLVFCASPGYLARRGVPKQPDDLARHACILFRLPSSGRDRAWEFRVERRSVAFVPESSLRLGDGEAIVAAAAAGLGIAQVPDNIAERELKRGRLVQVLSRYRPSPMPISLVYPSRRYVPLRVRLLADALVAEASRPRQR